MHSEFRYENLRERDHQIDPDIWEDKQRPSVDKDWIQLAQDKYQ
jgi:hypothetical protein